MQGNLFRAAVRAPGRGRRPLGADTELPVASQEAIVRSLGSSPSAQGGNQDKPGGGKALVKGKDLADAALPHQGQADGVGETESLVGILAQDLLRFLLQVGR